MVRNGSDGYPKHGVHQKPNGNSQEEQNVSTYCTLIVFVITGETQGEGGGGEETQCNILDGFGLAMFPTLMKHLTHDEIRYTRAMGRFLDHLVWVVYRVLGWAPT